MELLEQSENNGESLLKQEVMSSLKEHERDSDTLEIANYLVDILEGTELPEKFQISPDLTSTTNKSVKAKWEILFNDPVIKDIIFPSRYMMFFDPEDIDNPYDLETEPWVNMIHTWERVRNYMNTVSALQKGDGIDINKSDIICATAIQLRSYIVENPYLRSDKSFLEEVGLVETYMRRAGTKGVNPSRHVCMEEMKYILDTIKEVYRKEE